MIEYDRRSEPKADKRYNQPDTLQRKGENELNQ